MHLLAFSPDRMTDRPADGQTGGPSVLVLAASFQGIEVTLHGRCLRPSRVIFLMILVPCLVGPWALAEGQLRLGRAG